MKYIKREVFPMTIKYGGMEWEVYAAYILISYDDGDTWYHLKSDSFDSEEEAYEWSEEVMDAWREHDWKVR